MPELLKRSELSLPASLSDITSPKLSSDAVHAVFPRDLKGHRPRAPLSPHAMTVCYRRQAMTNISHHNLLAVDGKVSVQQTRERGTCSWKSRCINRHLTIQGSKFFGHRRGIMGLHTDGVTTCEGSLQLGYFCLALPAWPCYPSLKSGTPLIDQYIVTKEDHRTE